MGTGTLVVNWSARTAGHFQLTIIFIERNFVASTGIASLPLHTERLHEEPEIRRQEISSSCQTGANKWLVDRFKCRNRSTLIRKILYDVASSVMEHESRSTSDDRSKPSNRCQALKSPWINGTTKPPEGITTLSSVNASKICSFEMISPTVPRIPR